MVQRNSTHSITIQLALKPWKLPVKWMQELPRPGSAIPV